MIPYPGIQWLTRIPWSRIPWRRMGERLQPGVSLVMLSAGVVGLFLAVWFLFYALYLFVGIQSPAPPARTCLHSSFTVGHGYVAYQTTCYPRAYLRSLRES